MLRVLAFIDEPALISGLNDALRPEPDIELRCVPTLIALWAALEVDPPSVILINLTPAINLQTLRTIQSNARGCPLVLWLRSIDPAFACETVRAGIHGILRKTLPNDLLTRCLRVVASGELWIEASIAKQLIEKKAFQLTARERDLVDALAQGLRNKEIASLLNLTEASVKIYVSRLLKKLGLKDRFELGLYGLKHSGSVALEGITEAQPEPEPIAGRAVRKLPAVQPRAVGKPTLLRRAHSA